ncbi:MAG: hypothetical protein J6E46_08485 [Faecalicoccus sp.]|nr:hypothetical protein [Faecalicoccus sp.]
MKKRINLLIGIVLCLIMVLSSMTSVMAEADVVAPATGNATASEEAQNENDAAADNEAAKDGDRQDAEKAAADTSAEDNASAASDALETEREATEKTTAAKSGLLGAKGLSLKAVAITRDVIINEWIKKAGWETTQNESQVYVVSNSTEEWDLGTINIENNGAMNVEHAKFNGGTINANNSGNSFSGNEGYAIAVREYNQNNYMKVRDTTINAKTGKNCSM